MNSELCTVLEVEVYMNHIEAVVVTSQGVVKIMVKSTSHWMVLGESQVALEISDYTTLHIYIANYKRHTDIHIP